MAHLPGFAAWTSSSFFVVVLCMLFLPCGLALAITLFLFLAALSSWLTTAFLPSCVASVYHLWLMFPLNPFLPFISLSVSLCVLLAVSLSPFVCRLIQVCLRYLV